VIVGTKKVINNYTIDNYNNIKFNFNKNQKIENIIFLPYFFYIIDNIFYRKKNPIFNKFIRNILLLRRFLNKNLKKITSENEEKRCFLLKIMK